MKKELARKEEPSTLASTIDQWLSDVFEGRGTPAFPSLQFNWQPKVDIREDEKEYVISVSVPGVDKNNISVQVSDHTMSISGERKEESEEKTKGYLRREQAYGSFYRSFQLPENVNSDQIRANSKNGLLEIYLPKAEEQKSKAKRINID